MKRATNLLDLGMIVLATILGVGSIVLFAGMGTITGVKLSWTEPAALLWDAALSLAFFLQHSGMVRQQFRQRLTPWIPDYYQGAFYSIASGLVLTFVALLWQRTDTYLLVLEGLPLWITRVCALLALGVLIWGGLALGAFDLLGLAPIKARLRAKPVQSTPFTVRGPYRWVRHPLYSSIIVLFWVTPVLTTDRLMFNALWTGWIVLGTILEERDLTAKFGDEYRTYQRKVPMLIPWRGPV